MFLQIRFVQFCLVGGAVFIAGTVLQWALMRNGMASDSAYAWQTLASVELSFALNRSLTFRDRDVPVLTSLLKWNGQKAFLVVPNCVLYDVLDRAGAGWMLSNCVATGCFIAISYLLANRFSFRRVRVQWLRLALAAGLVSVPVAILLVPQARPLVYAAWMMPLAELALLLSGAAWYSRRFREAGSKYSRVILQITTVGNEPERVGEIIRQVRDYHVDMPLSIWVVTEPEDQARYLDADLVLHVPAEFECTAKRKGRALEYSRQVRGKLRLDRPDIKILLNDDDVTPTRAYIETAFRADYDVCEGIVTPRTGYGVRPLGHFLASHADDIRTHACLVYCSVFQGIFGRPLHVHGEGLVITGSAEALVTWDRDCLSEDLSFGQTACKLGLNWGWFHEYVEVTSPWTLSDYLVQRRRWLWGDIRAVRSRTLMGWGAAGRVAFKYLEGLLVLSCSGVGLWLRFTGRIPATEGVLNFGKLAMIAWVAVYFACGWVSASSSHDRRSDDSRMLSGVLAVLLMPVSALLAWTAVVVPLVQGEPGDFQTIRKTR
jgi:putative flippase GtrA